MGSVDRVEERTFRVNFTGDGAAKLRESLKVKLKEFMGDYTDDTLVEYVVVLLKNGRRKEEARNELDVFLGDHTDTFVSWLWDHLASNFDLYVQPQETCTDEVPKSKIIPEDQADRDDSHHVELDTEKGTSDNLTRTRHKREWKDLTRDVTELPPLRSSEVDNISSVDKTHQKMSRTRRSPSPRPQLQRKRSHHEGRQNMTREVSQTTIDAPRRLLQFAVRDAVGTPRPSSSVKEPTVKEPSLKRLRSVVSTPTEDSSLVVRPRKIQSIARVPNPMATVVKAVREAAEDVKKGRSSGSVFDRLGHDMDVPFAAERVSEFRNFSVEDEEYDDVNQLLGQTHANYLQSDYRGHLSNTDEMESETGLISDLMRDDEGYVDIHVRGHRVVDVSHTGASSGTQGENSQMVPYKVARTVDDSKQTIRYKDQNRSFSVANTSRKVVNNSVDINTWKPPPYQESRDIEGMENQNSVHENEVDALKSGVQPMENSNPATIGNGHQAKLAADIPKETFKALPSAPGSYTAGRPLEDVDSRTIFVSNVHFAATKDSLSRHFNKFGEVLKVVIVTDATTGQPTGSAYVEFIRKDAADNALSLDGTSFMSRILKVVKRSSAHQETTPVMPWPRIVRGSPYPTPRFARVPFPRGIPGAFRPHLPTKPGARSLQWKRDTQATSTESGAPVSGNSVFTSTARSLTYVRTEPKPDANSGTT